MTERPAQISNFFSVLYLRLPGQMRGMVLLLCATILFSSMHALIRHVGEAQHPFEMAFFRNLFGFIVLAPFFVRYGFVILKTNRLGLHALRGGVHVGSMLLFFYRRHRGAARHRRGDDLYRASFRHRRRGAAAR